MKKIINAILGVIYRMEVCIYNMTGGYELPMLRKIWRVERRLIQRALDRERFMREING